MLRAPTGNRTQGKCLEGIYVATTPLVRKHTTLKPLHIYIHTHKPTHIYKYPHSHTIHTYTLNTYIYTQHSLTQQSHAHTPVPISKHTCSTKLLPPIPTYLHSRTL